MFEASPKYVVLKCRLIKTLLHKQLRFTNAQIIKTETETPYISKIYKYSQIFKEKSNFVVDFMSMFSKIWFTFLASSIKLNLFVSE